MTTGKIEIKRLGDKDTATAQQLFLTLQQVFNVDNLHIVEKHHIIRLLQNPAFICLAAIYNSEVVGGLTAYELPMYDADRSEIFIYDIGVKPEYQRKGIGKKLLEAIKQYASDNGIKQLFVDANEEDKHALDFYRSMNTKEENVVQFTFRNHLT